MHFQNQNSTGGYPKFYKNRERVLMKIKDCKCDVTMAIHIIVVEPVNVTKDEKY